MSDKGNEIRVAGIIISILLFFILLYAVSSVPFPHSTYSSREGLPIKPGEDLGSEMSLFLWNYRGLDILIASILLLTTAISCLALLREEKPI